LWLRGRNNDVDTNLKINQQTDLLEFKMKTKIEKIEQEGMQLEFFSDSFC
jgi:hypothetical protein